MLNGKKNLHITSNVCTSGYFSEITIVRKANFCKWDGLKFNSGIGQYVRLYNSTFSLPDILIIFMVEE